MATTGTNEQEETVVTQTLPRDQAGGTSRDLSMTALVDKVSHREALSELYINNLAELRTPSKISHSYSKSTVTKKASSPYYSLRRSHPPGSQESTSSDNTHSSYASLEAPGVSPEVEHSQYSEHANIELDSHGIKLRPDTKCSSDRDSPERVMSNPQHSQQHGDLGSERDSGIGHDIGDVHGMTDKHRDTDDLQGQRTGIQVQSAILLSEKPQPKSSGSSRRAQSHTDSQKTGPRQQNKMTASYERPKKIKDSNSKIPYRLRLDTLPGKRETEEESLPTSSNELPHHITQLEVVCTSHPANSLAHKISHKPNASRTHPMSERITRMEGKFCIQNGPSSVPSRIMFIDAFASRTSYSGPLDSDATVGKGEADEISQAIASVQAYNIPRTHRVTKKEHVSSPFRKRYARNTNQTSQLSSDTRDFEAMKLEMFELSIRSDEHWQNGMAVDDNETHTVERDICQTERDKNETKALNIVKTCLSPKGIAISPMVMTAGGITPISKKASPSTSCSQSPVSLKTKKRLVQPKAQVNPSPTEPASTWEDAIDYLNHSGASPKSLASLQNAKHLSKERQGNVGTKKNGRSKKHYKNMSKCASGNLGEGITGQAATILTDRSALPGDMNNTPCGPEVCAVQIGDRNVLAVDHFSSQEVSRNGQLGHQLRKHAAGSDVSALTSRPPPNTPFPDLPPDHMIDSPFGPVFADRDDHIFSHHNDSDTAHQNSPGYQRHYENETTAKLNVALHTNAKHIDIHLPKVSMCPSPDT